MIDYAPLYNALDESPLAPWLEKLPRQIDDALSEKAHGNLNQWLEVVAQLPSVTADSVDICSAAIRVNGSQLSDEQRHHLEQQLRCFHPWRKGPYHIHGIDIDTEWRSDWKWQRLAGQIQPLQGRHVLDVGCGNGYHCWRMAGAGAELVIGIDPTLLFVMQYQVIRHFIGERGVYVLPLGIEALPPGLRAFDTVFSMGVLYHRRSPMDHLLELRGSLRRGGELVLETLVVDGEQGYALLPERRYAKMRNVWFLPSCATLQLWLKRCGFSNVRIVDVSATTGDEQRATPWMTFESLQDFLDPNDPSLTIEGLPAPRRAIVLADAT